MSSEITALLQKEELSREDVIKILRCDDDDAGLLYAKASATREKYLGKNVFLKGLVEYSNICSKNCLFCGARKDNNKIRPYTMSEDEVMEAVVTARNHGLRAIVIQGGDAEGEGEADKIESLVKKIRALAHNDFSITLSLGEHSREAYKKWYDAGADRYMLRIEASGIDLYKKIHPGDDLREYHRRLECLESIKHTGYQTGTGLMVGLPQQTLLNLADDIFFMHDFDIDMCCLGPFVEHTGTAPGKNGTGNYFLLERLELTLRMIAIMRIMMKDINIVSSMAMQLIDPDGMEKSILAGANIIMSNLTPGKYNGGYDPPRHAPSVQEIKAKITGRLRLSTIPGTGSGEVNTGDAVHYRRRLLKNR